MTRETLIVCSDTRKPAGNKSNTSNSPEVFSNGEKRYEWPPPRDPNLSYKEKSRHPVLSLITALPLIMLVAGLYYYYHVESEQTNNTPIEAESRELTASFAGLSETRGRHYLWVEFEGTSKGIRVREQQVPLLEAMTRGENVVVQMAPSITGSTTLWALRVEQAGRVFLDRPNSLP